MSLLGSNQNYNQMQSPPQGILSMKQTNIDIEFEDGKKMFTINHWGPDRFWSNMPIIGKFIITPISILLGSAVSELKGASIDQLEKAASSVNLSESLPMAIITLFETMQEEDINRFFSILFSTTYAQGNTAVAVGDRINEVFGREPYLMIDLAVKVLEVNYGPFFKRKGLFGLLKTALPMGHLKQLFPEG
jgi:hypothetical protein